MQKLGIVVAIVIPVAGGLGFIAFNDPTFFMKLAEVLVIGLAGLFIAAFLWTFAVYVSGMKINERLKYEHNVEVKNVIGSLNPFAGWITLITFIGVLAYLAFLMLWVEDRLHRFQP